MPTLQDYNPIESLAEKLCTLPRAGSFASTIDDLSARENALHLAVRLALTDAPDGRRLVLVVDQFEEVFTLCPREQEPLRRAFLDNLLYVATIACGRTVVILTMRADFYARCAAYSALAAALSEHQYLVGPMTRDELREAIEQPAIRSGAEFDPGLVDDLRDEVADRPAALPMLEFALMRLWDRRDGRRLTHAAYNAMKGLEGALAQRADEVLAALDPAQRDVCRRVFLRLTQPGEGTEDTRRRAPLAELVPAGADPADVESVVRKLADARLVRTGDAVEVVHEALLRGWPALRTWLDADRQGHLTYLGLVARAREWDQHARDPGLLDTGTRLAAAREWSEKHPGEPGQLGTDFLSAGLEAEHEPQRSERAATRRLIGLLSAGLVAFMFLSIVTLGFYQRAAEGARHGIALGLAAQANMLLRDRLDLALLLSVEAYRFKPTYETFTTLFAGSLVNPRLKIYLHYSRPLKGVAYSPDGKTLASASWDGTSIVWDVDVENSAIRRAGRNLTDYEWYKYMAHDVPCRRTSKLYPPGERAVEGK